MGEVTSRSKPLQVNPFKLSQPLGATLAFLGVDGCMPLMHGGQGCTSFTKVYFTRHFGEPIAIQTTAISDAVAVLDGGDYSIIEAVRNITAKVKPCLIGLHTTGLPETKGDDLRGVAAQVDFPLVWVNTPDYEGGLESGWALATTALIAQLTESADLIIGEKMVLLPHVSMTPIEVERLRLFIESFGFTVVVMPDLSTSLDGHLGQKQAALSSGGIRVDDISALANANWVMSVGASMKSCAAQLQRKNPALRSLHFSHLHGLQATDALVTALLAASGQARPADSVRRWRARLQDTLLDSHFLLGQTRFLVAAEADQLAGVCAAIGEAGGKVTVALAPTPSPVLAEIKADRVLVGDLEDAEDLATDYDLIVGGGHCEALAHRLGKGFVLRGFPSWEQMGNQLKTDCLYEGGAYFLCEMANEIARMKHHGE